MTPVELEKFEDSVGFYGYSFSDGGKLKLLMTTGGSIGQGISIP